MSNNLKQDGEDRRKNSLRLPDFDYSLPYFYSITICTANRNNYFVDDNISTDIVLTLSDCVNKFKYKIIVFCLMPDHLHLLISPEKSEISVSDFVRHFKSRTSFYFKKKTGKALWQRGFYDHVVRKSEELQQVADYIYHNPVRKGLVNDPRDYPYSGPNVGANL